jgi:inhibitor of KinA
MRNGAEPLTFAPLGEQAVVVSFGSQRHELVHQRIVRLAKRLMERPFPGFRECVPSYTTLCVYFDLLEFMHSYIDLTSPYRKVCEILEQLDREAEASQGGQEAEPTKSVRIPVCYCPQCGPDLQETAALGGISVQEAVRLHASAAYTVSCIGFLPGFPYLTGLSEALHVPRLKTPRKAVPPGSVGIANGQTGIYPQRSPGGWRLIGRTPLQLFRPEARPPSLLAVGDQVSFHPISHEEFERGAADHGFSR